MVKMWPVTILLFLVAVVSAQEQGAQSDDPDKIVLGDMVLTRRQHKWLFKNDSIKRHGLSNKAFRWPGGVVPVVISPQISRNFQNTIRAAADYISRGTCVRFTFDVDPRNQPNHLKIKPGGTRICQAQVGYNSRGPIDMKLDQNSCIKGTIIHELLHVLGLYHMHTAADRDNYVVINYNNIQADRKDQFKKITQDVSMFNTAYEYNSIMHYAPNAFANNPNVPTITTVGGRQATGMGQREIMTPGDFQRVNRMYECGRK